MSPEIDLQALASRRIVYAVPGPVVTAVHGYTASDGTTQPIDVYRPAAASVHTTLPAVLMVGGYPDAGFRRLFGRYAKDIGSNVSWAELMASSGLAVVSFVNVDPVADAMNVLDHVRRHATELGIDAGRIGVWSCSGAVPNALNVLMNAGDAVVKCAALLYGYMLDMDGTTHVRDASKFGFVTPAQGKSVADLPPNLPLLIARAGLDEMPGLNATIDAFVAGALQKNLPVTVVNHHQGPHAFDAVHDSDDTRRIIQLIVTFFISHLLDRARDSRGIYP